MTSPGGFTASVESTKSTGLRQPHILADDEWKRASVTAQGDPAVDGSTAPSGESHPISRQGAGLFPTL
jgi:hypothetical protein